MEILSGVFEDKTLGTPIAAIVRNTNQRSQDYDQLKTEDRPGHADARVARALTSTATTAAAAAPAGARRSAASSAARSRRRTSRATCPRCAPSPGSPRWGPGRAPCRRRASRARRWTRTPRAARTPPCASEMARRILAAKEAGDSLGGSIDVRVEGLPVGLGEPIFGKLKALIAQALGSIGAVTGVVWGPPDLLARIGQPGTDFHSKKECLRRHPGRPRQRRAHAGARLLQASRDAGGAREGRAPRPVHHAARRAGAGGDGVAGASPTSSCN